MSVLLTPTESLLERLYLIPDELTDRDQWVCWRMDYQYQGAKEKTKIPFQARNGRRAKANDPETWASFDAAVAAFTRRLDGPREYLGIGYVFSSDDPYVGIDFDGCVTGDAIAEPVRSMLRLLNGYAEISPSGTGVKCWVRGSLPIAKTGRQSDSVEGYKQIEMYHKGRFFTVTGRRIDDE